MFQLKHRAISIQSRMNNNNKQKKKEKSSRNITRKPYYFHRLVWKNQTKTNARVSMALHFDLLITERSNHISEISKSPVPPDGDENQPWTLDFKFPWSRAFHINKSSYPFHIVKMLIISFRWRSACKKKNCVKCSSVLYVN